MHASQSNYGQFRSASILKNLKELCIRMKKQAKCKYLAEKFEKDGHKMLELSSLESHRNRTHEIDDAPKYGFWFINLRHGT